MCVKVNALVAKKQQEKVTTLPAEMRSHTRFQLQLFSLKLHF